MNELLLLGICAVVVADELYISSDHDCSKDFNLDALDSVTLKYEGGSLLTEKCETKFTIGETFNTQICVHPESVNLGCDTEIEYHRFFVSEYTNNGILSCSENGQSSYHETCEENTDKYYIIIRRQSSTAPRHETASIRVYKKAMTDPYVIIIVVSVVVPVLSNILIMGCCICIRRHRQQQSRANTVQYTTTVCAPPTQAGYTQPGFPGTNAQAPTGGYHVHPMVTAVPNQTQPAPSQYGNQPVPYNNPPGLEPLQTGGMQTLQGTYAPAAYPSAPPQDDRSAPPPSFESLVMKQA